MKAKYVALLGNVDRTILNLQLRNGFSIEQWGIEKFVDLCVEMHGTAEHDIWAKLDDIWGYGHKRKYRPTHVYVITNSFSNFPELIKGINGWIESLMERNRFEYECTSYLEDQIRKLRLCCEGAIKICIEFYYSNDNGELMLESSKEGLFHGESRLFKVRKKDQKTMQGLLDGPPLTYSQKYINLALENFNQSFEIPQTELEFLILMLSLEAIFNDGKQELRNKVARGCAVLIGKNKNSCREIFREVRDLYDKRSVLVHTGDKSKINEGDILLLKNFVRQSLLRVIQLNLPKDMLSSALLETGFGGYRQIN